MPFGKFMNKTKSEPTAGGNTVFSSAASEPGRRTVVVKELEAVLPGQYVIFADHSNLDNYVQFARFRTGGLVMEVASGIHNQGDGPRLADSPRAAAALTQLGLELIEMGNFTVHGLSISSDQIATWVEMIFRHLYGAEEGFQMDTLADPARAPQV